jgi:hypothetical protein
MVKVPTANNGSGSVIDILELKEKDVLHRSRRGRGSKGRVRYNETTCFWGSGNHPSIARNSHTLVFLEFLLLTSP